MRAIIGAGMLAAAVLWAGESIAREPKRPVSLPALDFSCYIAQSTAFTTLGSTDSELGIGADNYGKPVFRFATIGGSTLKVVEFPEFASMRKEYEKHILELRFGNGGGNDIFGWSDNEAMGLRIFTINRRDGLVSILEAPSSAQALPFGTLRVLKCNDAVKTVLPPEALTTPSWSEGIRGASPMLDRVFWRASKATFPKSLTMQVEGSVPAHSGSSRQTASKVPSPLNRQAAR